MVKRGVIATVLGLGFLLALFLAATVPGEGWAAEKDVLGGEFTLISGANSGPFGTDTDFAIGGALGIPLFRPDPLFGQNLLGEVMIGWSKTRGAITAVSPLTAVGAPAAAVTSTRFEITTLEVLLGFKYKVEALGRIQPFLTAGVGFNVFLCETKGAALAGGDFICGAAPIPPELRARDVPVGQGNIRPAAALGGGVDFLLTNKIFVGAEVRHNLVSGDNDDFTTFGGRLGIRW
jgi:opacity protein-like surface antigen